MAFLIYRVSDNGPRNQENINSSQGRGYTQKADCNSFYQLEMRSADKKFNDCFFGRHLLALTQQVESQELKSVC